MKLEESASNYNILKSEFDSVRKWQVAAEDTEKSKVYEVDSLRWELNTLW